MYKKGYYMPAVDIASSVASDMQGAIVDYSVAHEHTDGPGADKEFTYQQRNWPKWLGYYKSIPELKIAIDTKANWVLGNGYEADNTTTQILERIRGNGKETFNSILEKLERTCYIAEDAYAEIIRDEKGVLLNLKTLDPSTIKVVHNRKGMVLRYEQVEKVGHETKTVRTFKPQDIFALSHNRVADEVHGLSVIESVEWIILARNEAMNDWKTVLHRNVYPLWIFKLDTDDTTKITNFKTTMDEARGKGENMYIPKGSVEAELVATAQQSGLNPLAWINQLNDYFFQAVGIPQIIVGNAKEFTDASGKIVYLAFEQRIRGRQLYVEEQVSQQLHLEINLVFPATLQNEALSDYPEQPKALVEEPIQKAGERADTQISPGGVLP